MTRITFLTCVDFILRISCGLRCFDVILSGLHCEYCRTQIRNIDAENPLEMLNFTVKSSIHVVQRTTILYYFLPQNLIRLSYKNCILRQKKKEQCKNQHLERSINFQYFFFNVGKYDDCDFLYVCLLLKLCFLYRRIFSWIILRLCVACYHSGGSTRSTHTHICIYILHVNTQKYRISML